MSEAADRAGTCPTCGNPTPADARFCPSCGTPLASAPVGDEWFRDAIDDVIVDGETPPAQSAPAEVAPVAAPAAAQEWVSPTTTPAAATPPDPAWTASPGEWSAPPPMVATPSEPTGWRRNRTMWIILGIVGFVIFCCCGSMMLVSAVSSADSAFQDEISFALARLSTR